MLRQKLPLFLFFVVIIFISKNSHSTCTGVTPVTQIVLHFPSTIAVGRDVAVGQVVARAQYIEGSQRLILTCGGGGTQFHSGMASTVPGYSNVYDIGVPGYGLRMSAQNSSGGIYWTIPSTETYTISLSVNWIGTVYFTGEIIKTSAVASSGSITPGQYGTLAGDGNTVFASWSIPAGSNISTTACSVTNPVINVTMPAVRRNALGGINGTSAIQPFSINLDCSAGATVYLTLTDATTPGNTGSTLSLAGGSTATGVGLQVLSGGNTVVSFGPDSPVAGNMHQWKASTSVGGTMSIPLGVRYIQTGSSMGVGQVVGAATFTMSYQ